MAWIYLIAAEHINTSQGIGHGIVLTQYMVRIDHILVYATRLTSLGAAIAALVLGTGDARAEPAAPAPLNYVVAGIGTTAVHRSSGGPVDGLQDDATPSVGIGRFVSATIALELDIGPTFVRGNYTGTSLVPGVVWAFSSSVYAAARFAVPVDPEINLGLYPGAGLVHTFQNGAALFAEGNVFSYVGRGNPDLWVALSAGAVYAF